MIFPEKKRSISSKKLTHDVAFTLKNTDMRNFARKFGNVAFHNGKAYSYNTMRLRNTFGKIDKILYVYRSGAYLVADGKVYRQTTVSANVLLPEPCNAATLHNGRLIYATPNGLKMQYSDREIIDENISHLAICNDHLIGLDTNEFYFCYPTENADYEMEYLDTPNSARAMAVCGKSVYLIGPTVYKVEMDADLKNVVFKSVADGFGTVVVGSASACNDVAVFATKSGLFKIVKDKVSRIFSDFDGVIDYNSVRGCFYNGQYYASCRTFDGEGATLVLDVENEIALGVPFGYFPQLISGGSGELWLHDGEHLFVYVDKRLEDADAVENVSVFTEQGIDFGVDGLKSLRSLQIDTTNDVTVTVTSERCEKTVKVRGKVGKQKIKIGGTGKSFDMRLSGNNFDVCSVSLCAQTAGGGV